MRDDFRYTEKLISKEQLRDMILNEEDISYVDYSHIIDMSDMFRNCNMKTIQPIDTSNVIVMDLMFDCCRNLESIPWMDTSNVVEMYAMFSECHRLKSIPLLDTSKAKDISFLFDCCFGLEEVPDLDTSSAEETENIFYNCKNLEKINHFNFPDYNWEETRSTKLKENYPELFI
jgi:hypothetical protein